MNVFSDPLPVTRPNVEPPRFRGGENVIIWDLSFKKRRLKVVVGAGGWKENVQ